MPLTEQERSQLFGAPTQGASPSNEVSDEEDDRSGLATAIDWTVGTALRVIPPTAAIMGEASIPLTGAAGALGESGAQWYEKMRGIRKDFSPTGIAIGTVLPFVPGGSAGKTALGTVAKRAVTGGAIGLGSTAAETLIDQGRMPTAEEALAAGGVGAAFGGGMGAVEAASGIRAHLARQREAGKAVEFKADAGATEAKPRMVDIPVRGEGGVVLKFSTKEQAESHIATLKEADPEGDYKLSGWFSAKESEAERIGLPFRIAKRVKQEPEALPSPAEAPADASPETEVPAPTAPQTEKPVAPAYRNNGEWISGRQGDTHNDIRAKLGLKRVANKGDRETPDYGFVTDKGRIVSREEAAALLGKEGRLHTSDLPGRIVAPSGVVPVESKPVKPSGVTDTLPQGATSGAKPGPSSVTVEQTVKAKTGTGPLSVVGGEVPQMPATPKVIRDAVKTITKARDSVIKMVSEAEALRGKMLAAQRAGVVAKEAGMKEAEENAAQQVKNFRAAQKAAQAAVTQALRSQLPVKLRGKYLADTIRTLTGSNPLRNPQAIPGVLKLLDRIYAEGANFERNELANMLKEVLKKGIASPSVDVTKWKPMLRELSGSVNLKTADAATLRTALDRAKSLVQAGRSAFRQQQAKSQAVVAGITKKISTSDTAPLNRMQRIVPGANGAPMVLTSWNNFQNKVRSMYNLVAKTDIGLMPRDAAFAVLENSKGRYDGVLSTEFSKRVDERYAVECNEVNSIISKTAALVQKHQLGDASSRRIGIYAMLQQGVEERLLQSGSVSPEFLNAVKQHGLTDGEMAAYVEMRKAFDSMFPRLQETMGRLYNVELTPVENYFRIMRDWKIYEKDLPVERRPAPGAVGELDELGGMRALDFSLRQSPITTTGIFKGFTESRLPKAATPIELDAFKVFNQSVKDILHVIHMQETVRDLGRAIRTPIAKQKFGDMGQKFVFDWLDTVASDGRVDSFQRWKALDALRRNTSVGAVAFRLSSQFVHLANIPLAAYHVGGGWWSSGLRASMGDIGKDFIRKVYPQLFQRGFQAESAVMELKPNKLRDLGFGVARYVDYKNSSATFLGAYMRALARKGLNPHDFASLPVDAEAVNYARILMRRAVASPMSQDTAQALSRGGLTGGNVSLGRAIFQFQNVFLDQWSNIRYDLVSAGLNESAMKKSAAMTGAVLGMLLVETGIKQGFYEGGLEITGYRPSKKETFTERLELDALRRFPFAGQLMQAAMYKTSGIPIADTAVGTLNDFRRMVSAKTEAGRESAAMELGSSVMTAAGVPGSSYAMELARKKMRGDEQAAVESRGSGRRGGRKGRTNRRSVETIGGESNE